MIEIRPYRESDKQALRNICVETTLFPLNDKVKQWLPIAYNDYYTENCPDFAFVLADDDVPVGYIICSPNEKEYVKIMKEKYLPKIKKISKTAYITMKYHLCGKDRFPDYPAHLHIDILNGYRRLGMGTALMDKLFEKLRQENIKGVKLSCSIKNKSAIKFYEKYGFVTLKKSFYNVIMGKKTEVY